MALPLAGIGSILGGLGGLFGKKPKERTPADSLISHARGARTAAAETGFNPLTLLGTTPGGFTSSGGTPPLASIQMLTDGLSALDDEFSGDAKTRREHNQLSNDLLRIQLDQARGAVVQPPPPSAVASVSSRVSPLGGAAPSTVGTVAGEKTRPFGWLADWLTGDREHDVKPVENIPGVMVVDNSLTGGPIAVAGSDGDPWDLSQLVAVGVQAAPQMAINGYNTYLGGPSQRLYLKAEAGVGEWWKRHKKSLRDNYVDPNTPFQMWRN